MVPQWKRWLGTAAVLLLVGAGCEATVQPKASIDAEVDTPGEMEDDGQMKLDADASSSLDADAAVDAMLKESDDDATSEHEEGKDADIVENDEAELDAYGKAYVKSEL